MMSTSFSSLWRGFFSLRSPNASYVMALLHSDDTFFANKLRRAVTDNCVSLTQT